MRQVDQITFSGVQARAQGQRVIYVTERAVFELTREGVSLIEIAPGVDLESDILDRMGFAPHIGKVPRVMDEMLFTDVEGET